MSSEVDAPITKPKVLVKSKRSDLVKGSKSPINNEEANVPMDLNGITSRKTAMSGALGFGLFSVGFMCIIKVQPMQNEKTQNENRFL